MYPLVEAVKIANDQAVAELSASTKDLLEIKIALMVAIAQPGAKYFNLLLTRFFELAVSKQEVAAPIISTEHKDSKIDIALPADQPQFAVYALGEIASWLAKKNSTDELHLVRSQIIEQLLDLLKKQQKEQLTQTMLWLIVLEGDICAQRELEKIFAVQDTPQKKLLMEYGQHPIPLNIENGPLRDLNKRADRYLEEADKVKNAFVKLKYYHLAMECYYQAGNFTDQHATLANYLSVVLRLEEPINGNVFLDWLFHWTNQTKEKTRKNLEDKTLTTQIELQKKLFPPAKIIDILIQIAIKEAFKKTTLAKIVLLFAKIDWACINEMFAGKRTYDPTKMISTPTDLAKVYRAALGPDADDEMHAYAMIGLRNLTTVTTTIIAAKNFNEKLAELQQFFKIFNLADLTALLSELKKIFSVDTLSDAQLQRFSGFLLLQCINLQNCQKSLAILDQLAPLKSPAITAGISSILRTKLNFARSTVAQIRSDALYEIVIHCRLLNGKAPSLEAEATEEYITQLTTIKNNKEYDDVKSFLESLNKHLESMTDQGSKIILLTTIQDKAILSLKQKSYPLALLLFNFILIAAKRLKFPYFVEFILQKMRVIQLNVAPFSTSTLKTEVQKTLEGIFEAERTPAPDDKAPDQKNGDPSDIAIAQRDLFVDDKETWEVMKKVNPEESKGPVSQKAKARLKEYFQDSSKKDYRVDAAKLMISHLFHHSRGKKMLTWLILLINFCPEASEQKLLEFDKQGKVTGTITIADALTKLAQTKKRCLAFIEFTKFFIIRCTARAKQHHLDGVNITQLFAPNQFIIQVLNEWCSKNPALAEKVRTHFITGLAEADINSALRSELVTHKAIDSIALPGVVAVEPPVITLPISQNSGTSSYSTSGRVSQAISTPSVILQSPAHTPS